MIKLADICKKASSSIAQKDLDGRNGSYPIYGASGFIKNVDFYQQENPYVAVVKDGAGVGRVMCLPGKSSVIGTMQYIIPNNGINVHYLAYALESMNLAKYCTGATIPHIYFKDYCTEPLRNHSNGEQVKIADTLDKVGGLISLRKQQLAKLDELVKSQFIELFGDPERNPKGYEKRKLGSLAKKISDGVHAKPEYTETGRPFLSVVNINKGIINFEGCKFVSEEAYQKMIKSTHPERGDVLYTKVGATYGIPAYVDTDTEFCLYVSVCLIKPQHDDIDSRFLALSMSMPYIKRQADSRIKGIGVPDLHLNQISEFDILCPPREEQELFVTFVKQTDKSKLAIQKSLDQLELLKKASMQNFFG